MLQADAIAILHRYRDALTVAALLIVTRTIYLAMGLVFDASPAASYLQFIPGEWLEQDLLGSLYFSHASPPFLNLVTGIGLKLFGDGAWVFYALTWHLMGYALLYAVYFTARRLTGTTFIAWTVTSIIAISPAFHLYENWLMYTFPAACFVTVSAALLIRFLDAPTIRNGLLFFSTLALLVLTRSLFQLVWLVLVAVILLLIVPGARRQVVYTVALPLLVCVLWYGKNYYLYSTFSASSLLGLSLNNVTTLTLPREALQGHIRRQELSRFAVISRYTELADLLASEDLVARTGLPLLDETYTPAGTLNYNSLEMRVAGEYYLQDSLKVREWYPLNYGIAMLLSHQVYFSPAAMNRYFSDDNLAAVAPVSQLFDRIAYGSAAEPHDITQLHFGFSEKYHVAVNPGRLLIILSMLVLIMGGARCITTVASMDWRTETIVFGYLFGNWLMIYLIGTYAELYENNRYRFIAEPFYWILLAVILRQLWMTFVDRKRSG